MKAIGVFDSGVGGESVARAIRKSLPEREVIVVEDKDNLPYGDKSPQKLLELVTPILNKLSKKCDVIVVACNTVTTNIIEDLRRAINVPLIGMEPMVKPAAQMSKTGVIAVCATPATLKSKRYAWLKDNYAKNTKIIEPDCSNWTKMIEDNQVDRQHITQIINDVCQFGADVIVLGCTHYHWIESLIKKAAAGRAVVIQPEEPVICQLKKVLEQLP